MSFGEWRAYADTEHMGRHVRLHIRRETAPNTYEYVSHLNAGMGATVTTVIETPGVESVVQPIQIDPAVAEVLYTALHRVFGNDDPKGDREALQIERKRLDKVLDRFLDGVR